MCAWMTMSLTQVLKSLTHAGPKYDNSPEQQKFKDSLAYISKLSLKKSSISPTVLNKAL